MSLMFAKQFSEAGVSNNTGKKGGRVAVFGKKEHEAVFTWNSVTGAVAGSLHSAGRAWTLEGCGEGRFVWIEYK